MKAIRLKSWNKYLQTIEQIEQKYGSIQIGEDQLPVDIVYRGQADAKWPLHTTLERFTKNRWTLREYISLSLRVGPKIETFTEKAWDLPPIKDVENEMRAYDDGSLLTKIPRLDYLIYLRHHGFPSPLLDWTKSPYIAAFFAFAEHSDARSAAIFVYIEIPGVIKGVNEDLPNITPCDGSHERTHKRHFLQQSVYTVCTVNKGFDREFVSHENIFEWGDDKQDMLIKIVIPRKERLDILSHLKEMNINHFSLFQSEEALMQTLAFEEIEAV